MNEWVELGQNKDGTHNICCGVCGVGKFKSKGHARSYYTRHKFKYCPNCGAKMNADRKTEPQTERVETMSCQECKWWFTDSLKHGGYCQSLLYNHECHYEPEVDCSWK